MVLSGLVLCGCVDFPSTFKDQRYIWLTDLNGTHDLPHIGGTCQWQLTVTAYLRRILYTSTDGSCTGTPTNSDRDVQIDLKKTGATSASLSMVGVGGGSLFLGTATTDSDACDTFLFTNDQIGICDPSLPDENIPGYSGTATITA